MQRFPIQPVTDATVTEIIERLYKAHYGRASRKSIGNAPPAP